MLKYLPSKKFTYIVLAIIVALGLIYIFSWLGKAKTSTPKLTDLEVKSKVQEFMALDTDNDNLKDWEEALYKTDPKNPDTDKDGTSDGVEVNANRDPLQANTAKAGALPTDKIPDQVIASQKKAVDDYNSLSDTDKMARLLFSQFLATKKIGQTMTDIDITNVVNSTLNSISSPTFKQYSLSDLNNFNATNSNQLKDYGNKVAEIILTNQPKVKVSLEEIMNSITETDTSEQIAEKLKALQPVITYDQGLVTNLLKLKVPSEFASAHLSYINTIVTVGDSLKKILTSSKDLLTIIYLTNTYSNDVNNLYQSLKAIKDLFIEKNIIFSTTDLGYNFFMI